MAIKRITIGLNTDLLSAVDQYAEQWGTSRTAAISFMLSNYVETSQALKVLPTLMANADKLQVPDNKKD